MTDQNEEKKELTPAQKLVNKETSEIFKLLSGVRTTLKGIDNKLKIIKKASED